MKTNTLTKLLTFALVCAITFTACVKERTIKPEKKISLAGSWTETPPAGEYTREIFFSADSAFTMHYIGLVTPLFSATSTGTYKIEGDKLIVSIKEVFVKEANKPGITTTLDQVLFDKATFSLKSNLLNIDFVTYPADGPVPTNLKFLKN
ncbi:hypothetical protein [Mucilaginibacter gynuensis]